VKEARSFIKARAIAIGLTLVFGTLLLAALSLAVLGGQLEEWIGSALGSGVTPLLSVVFAVARWAIIAAALLLAFAVTYYKGPNVEQKFKFITPGAVVGVVTLALASAAFNFYVSNFGKYDATYGSIGAVIVLMLWLYVAGLVLLLGSEVNALVEHYQPGGKDKGERLTPGTASRQGVSTRTPPNKVA
jgi:membrane protein